MAKQCMKQQGLIMTGTNQLEMKLHEQADQLAHLRHEVLRMKEQLEKTQATLLNLCERLHVQG
jgi:uncharacterized coiled-coil protein SlyX